jgi:hypothetical protein
MQQEKKYILPADKIAFIKESIEKLKAENKSNHEAGEFDSYNFRIEGRYKAFEEILQWISPIEHTVGSGLWVKASERLPSTGLVVWRWIDKTEAYTGYKEKGGFHFGTGGARVDPTYYSEIEWLDEQPVEQKENEAVVKLLEFARDISENWDCDPDSHTYNTPCRKCEATKLYNEYQKQKKQ